MSSSNIKCLIIHNSICFPLLALSERGSSGQTGMIGKKMMTRVKEELLNNPIYHLKYFEFCFKCTLPKYYILSFLNIAAILEKQVCFIHIP